MADSRDGIKADMPSQTSAAHTFGEVAAGPADVVAADTATGARSVDNVLSGLPKGKQGFVRTVPDEQALQSTFNDLTRDATQIERKGYDGTAYQLRDGTQIGMRGSSSSGGATIDIRNPDGSINKIHIGP